MRLSDLICLCGRDGTGGINLAGALAVRELTLEQLEIVAKDPKAVGEFDDESWSEREYHRMYAAMNCWPAWLEEREWRKRQAA